MSWVTSGSSSGSVNREWRLEEAARDWSTIVGVAYRLPSINATLSVAIPAHSILISKSTVLLQAKGY